MLSIKNRKQRQRHRHIRLRKKITGTPDHPRLAIHFSSKHIVAQVIDDSKGVTITSVNTTELSFRTSSASSCVNIATSEKVGALIAARSLEKNLTKVVFDRGGFKYHGKVKALAEAVRNGGLQF